LKKKTEKVDDDQDEKKNLLSYSRDRDGCYGATRHWGKGGSGKRVVAIQGGGGSCGSSSGERCSSGARGGDDDGRQ
jgi:hypothetical protein